MSQLALCQEERDAYRDERDRLRTVNAKLLEALKYYADPRAYVPCNPDDSQPLIVRKDGGKHARAAIEAAQ